MQHNYRWNRHGAACGRRVRKPRKGGEAASAKIQGPASCHSVRRAGDIRPHEIPGLFKSALSVDDGNSLLFGAQILSAGELESSERAGFRRGQRRVGLVVPVEFFLDAQRPVGLDVS